MNTIKSFKCSLLIGLTFFIASCFIETGPANAWSVYRHIYNKSPDTIEFYFDADRGNVYFQDGPCNVKNGPCTLPPGASSEIKFTETGGKAEGHVNILCKSCKDATPVSVWYAIENLIGETYARAHVKGGTGVEDGKPYEIWYYFCHPARMDITVYNIWPDK